VTALVPSLVTAHGRTWTVRRAWPRPAGDGADLEVTADGIVGVRAGRWCDGDVRVAEAVCDRRLPALADIAGDGEVVSWRPGRRAVVRLADGRGYAKVVRVGAAEPVLAAHAAGAAFSAGFARAAVTSAPTDAVRGVVRFAPLPGRTLFDLGADRRVAEADFAGAWNGWAEAWGMLLDAPSGETALHDAEAEARVLEQWMRHAEPHLGAEAPAVRSASDRVTRALVSGPRDRTALAHRDLHDKQVMWEASSRPGLLDLDTVTTAEAALDLGNLRAHVAFRAAQGRLDATRAAVARAAIDGVARAAGVEPGRVHAYESATRMRLGALYLFRPAWRELALRWLRGA